ncbi:hypothetical protein Ocin01_13752 [Orchesella cincta]|uniref:Uncharacterized protein n=1 Tax=Orchesella cincta TaxID=48709 RepID=A0A1D2MJ32_ORCCI|nr:hypothetical protein Ocin01_13752 [Orchesella cincta]
MKAVLSIVLALAVAAQAGVLTTSHQIHDITLSSPVVHHVAPAVLHTSSSLPTNWLTDNFIMKNTFAYREVTALLVAVTIIPYILVFSNGLTTRGVNSTSNDIDLETLSLFGVTPEFAEQFRLNLLKAIELEEKGERDQLRQEFGGVSGGFYQGGNAGAGGAGSAVGGGNQEEDGDEEDEKMLDQQHQDRERLVYYPVSLEYFQD